MMMYLKKGITRGLKGLPIGLAIGYSFLVLMSATNQEIILDFQITLANYAMAAFVGFYLSAVTVVYDIEEWSILKQSVTHSILSLPYIPLAIEIGWAPEDLVGQILFIIVYIIIFIVIWLTFRTYWKKQAEQLKEAIQVIKGK